jgi:Tol biopolymer transport system component
MTVSIVKSLIVSSAILMSTVMPVWAGTTTRISIGLNGAEANGGSAVPTISANGRWIAFNSGATNLIEGDTNGHTDVFVHDRQTSLTSRVSVGPDGIQGDGGSYTATISANGRFVVFSSDATNLVPGDTNGMTDLFIHDRQTGVTSYAIGRSLSANGRFVAFTSDATDLVPGDTNSATDVFVQDRQTGATSRVSVGPQRKQANGSSYATDLSADGRFVAFQSDATNLTRGDTNGVPDVFVHDRQTGLTRRVSLGPNGKQANNGSGGASLSANGRFVLFVSDATNLVHGDTNNLTDAFVHDSKNGVTSRVSIGPRGKQLKNGFIYFIAGPGNQISGDGRFVVFDTDGIHLVRDDTNNNFDVFLHDRKTGVTSSPSVGHDGAQGSQPSYHSAISADGRHVVFASRATNFAPGDTNDTVDVFVYDH